MNVYPKQYCTDCGREMLLLFQFYSCEWCSHGPAGQTYKGYIIYRGEGTLPRKDYVFKSQEHAEKWLSIRGMATCSVRVVAMAHEPRWRMSSGSASDLELADHLFEIFPDHKVPERDYVAWLVS